jgi:hypothetical protein
MLDLDQITWIYPVQPQKLGDNPRRWSPTATASCSVMFAPLKWRCRRSVMIGFGKTDLFDEAMTDADLDKILAIIALASPHYFVIGTKHAERAKSYFRGWDQSFCDDCYDCKRRVTLAVNAVMLGSGRNWGDCGSTNSWITTNGHEDGLPEVREPNMLRKTSDGGVERLLISDGNEVWHRCHQEFADQMLKSWWGSHDRKICWGLKAWPLPNVAIGVRETEQREAA